VALSDYAISAGNGAYYPWFFEPGYPDGVGVGVAYRPDFISGSFESGGGSGNIYSGWELSMAFGDVRDGLSNTLLIGEKFVYPEHQGETFWGDGTFWSGDLHSPTTRVAGESFPLARSDTDKAVLPDYVHMPFGGPHSGICQFVFCDGRVRELNVSINTTVLGYLATRDDGQLISADQY